ncbi:hypothetical protein HW432_05855 [Bacillus pumilus]|uniref:hypothetical protein n=1 Tax=Bacillus TaxID=1386 RepID=UPI000D7BE6A4|nr:MULTISPECIES: hypothetical protein [Bacillus]MBB6601804.1 hypothetical protein [Bacillus pumilus]WEZ69946.1 hypothetical protein P5623_12005 [Bacillus altitudinis]WLF28852.1 hypothetical protein Q6357_10330 [Bacillus altitudinis]
MKITVNEQPQRFYLATEKLWKPMVGHEIRVGKYRFCAIPMDGHINITEVTSGLQIVEIPMSLGIMTETVTKEGAISWLYKVGESLVKIVKTKDYDKQLEKMKKMAIEKLGDMPSIEDVDMDWIFEDESGVLN